MKDQAGDRATTNPVSQWSYLRPFPNQARPEPSGCLSPGLYPTPQEAEVSVFALKCARFIIGYLAPDLFISYKCGSQTLHATLLSM